MLVAEENSQRKTKHIFTPVLACESSYGRKISDTLKCDHKFKQPLRKSRISMAEEKMDSAASGSWGNYWAVCEDVHIAPLFPKQLKIASCMEVQTT
jgi:hypothetical protein